MKNFGKSQNVGNEKIGHIFPSTIRNGVILETWAKLPGANDHEKNCKIKWTTITTKANNRAILLPLFLVGIHYFLHFSLSLLVRLDGKPYGSLEVTVDELNGTNEDGVLKSDGRIGVVKLSP